MLRTLIEHDRQQTLCNVMPLLVLPGTVETAPDNDASKRIILRFGAVLLSAHREQRSKQQTHQKIRDVTIVAVDVAAVV